MNATGRFIGWDGSKKAEGFNRGLDGWEQQPTPIDYAQGKLFLSTTENK
jgi:hypothetical protein